MNIVFISMLSGKKSAGISYSIPLQIKSQAKFDNVFWYNITNTPKTKLINGSICYNIEDFPSLKISELPIPFNKPDLVVFEGVYIYKYLIISKECKTRDIPYIIIPRGSLTKNAQKKKAIKKKLGNIFLFNSFIKGARAIQFLTEKEFKDSGDKWNKNYFVIPNGVEPKTKIKKYNVKQENIRGIFIGRADSYHKGIDLLLDACSIVKSNLKQNNCVIDLYAPNSTVDKDNVQLMINDRGLENIVFHHDGIYGSDKEKELLNSDFFILTSRFEGHPMGLIEALSYGLPCLVTDGTNMGDKIKKVNAGWVANTTVESIAEALILMLNEKDKFWLKGKNALKLSKEYEWDLIAKMSSNRYRELIL